MTFQFSMPQNEVALRILQAADALMAKDGVQGVSTHKVAKAAGVSVGTIYLYFKDKDDLLTNLVHYLFARFEHYAQCDFDANQPLWEQYRLMWLNHWQFLQENPDVVMNIHQYESIPSFQQLILDRFKSDDVVWNQFVKCGKSNQQIADLPNNILFSLSIKSAWHLSYLQLVEQIQYADGVIEDVILRTWKAISI